MRPMQGLIQFERVAAAHSFKVAADLKEQIEREHVGKCVSGLPDICRAVHMLLLGFSATFTPLRSAVYLRK